MCTCIRLCYVMLLHQMFIHHDAVGRVEVIMTTSLYPIYIYILEHPHLNSLAIITIIYKMNTMTSMAATTSHLPISTSSVGPIPTVIPGVPVYHLQEMGKTGQRTLWYSLPPPSQYDPATNHGKGRHCPNGTIVISILHPLHTSPIGIPTCLSPTNPQTNLTTSPNESSTL